MHYIVIYVEKNKMILKKCQQNHVRDECLSQRLLKNG